MPAQPAPRELLCPGECAAARATRHDRAFLRAQAIELDGSNAVYFSNRSAALLSKKDSAGALVDAERCIALRADWPKGYARKGAALHALERLDEAEAAYNDGLQRFPGDGMLERGLGDVRRAAAAAAGPFGGMNPFAGLLARVEAAPEFADDMKRPGFRQKVQLLEANPNLMSSLGSDPDVMRILGFALGIDLTQLQGGPEGAGEPAAASGEAAPAPAPAAAAAAAEDDVEPAAEPEPEVELTEEEKEERARKQRALALKEEGNAAYKGKDFEAAARLYDQAIELDPDEIAFRNNRAAVFFEEGELDRCVEFCRETLKHAREIRAPFAMIAKVYARMGNAHMKRKDFDAAIEAYEASLAESSSPDVRTRLRRAKKLRAEKAERDYRDPEKAVEAKELGNTQFKDGKFKEAIEAYSDAIRRDPDCAVYYANRAAARTKLMDFPAALKDCDAALALDPKYVKAFSRRGAIHFFMKEYHKAMDDYQAGLAVDEGNAECQEGIQRTIRRIQEASAAPPDPERQQRAMADPEIQGIISDPMVSQALRDLQSDPSGLSRVMSDPAMSRKINRLIQAGVLSFGGAAPPAGGGMA